MTENAMPVRHLIDVTEDKYETELEALRTENAALRAKQAARRPTPTCKVAQPRPAGTNGPQDKGSLGGALSVYGLGRFPVTLYKEQWLVLLGMADEILAFIVANDSKLSVK